MATEKIKVPDLGDSGEVEVIELLVSVGQTVEENDSLLVLESDKAAMEIPAPTGGVVKSIAVNLGDQVTTGTEILTLDTEDSDSADDADKDGSDASEGTADSADDDKNKSGDSKDKNKEKGKDDDSKADQQADEGADGTGKQGDKGNKESKKASGSNAGGGSGEPVVKTLEVPDLGGEDDVEVIEIHVSEGDSINVDDALITLESDKAAMDVPATHSGEVKSLKVKVGDKVSKGAEILELLTQPENDSSDSQESTDDSDAATGGDSESAAGADRKTDAAAESKAESASKKQSSGRPEGAPEAGAAGSTGADIYAGPAVRKLARELGVELSQVPGTGSKGRILKEDIHEFVKSRLSQGPAAGSGIVASPVPDIDFSQFGEVEQVSMSKLHKVTAVNMQRNWSTVPHVAQFNEADVSELEAFRKDQRTDAEKKGVKLTFLPFLLKACVKTLQEYPQFNVSLHSSGEYYFQKKYYHIGVAVATDAGLLVPVIRNVDKKSLWDLAAELGEISDKAKQRRLTKEDMQGACFTISSLGAIGGTGFIPIINAPEVAILGVGKTELKPVYRDGELVPRSMLPLTLSYDHRAVNGVDGGLFSSHLVKLLGDIRLLLL